MRSRGHLPFVAVLCLVLFYGLALGQSSPPTPTRDATALQIISQTLLRSGWIGSSTLPSDFRGEGDVTYHWAGSDVHGTVVLLGKGTDHFRQTTSLPDQSRDFAVNFGVARESKDGKIRKVPYQNSAWITTPNFLIPTLALTAAEPANDVRLLPEVQEAGRRLYQIEVRRNFDSAQDPGGLLSKLRTTTYFVDAVTFDLVKTRSTYHADDNMLEDYPLEDSYSDFREINGIRVPFSITEHLAGQHTWDINLTSFTFNVGTSDTDFNLQ